MSWPGLFLLVATTPVPASAQTVREAQKWYFDAVEASAAQELTRGEGVTVAVVDTGVDAAHPDLAGALLPGKSFFGADSDAGQTDPVGHGTRMAGVIAARGGGENNALGIAPAAKVLPVAVPPGIFESYGDAIRWAADQGVQVMNLSLGRAGLVDGDAEAIAYALQHDVVVVVAAGNISDTPGGNAWAMLPGVVAVSGYAKSGIGWSGSARGDHIALAAPADQIIAPSPLDMFESGYSGADGTSESCAIVSGVAALIRAKFPELDAANVINRLIVTAVDKAAPGRDTIYGYGLVNARLALTADVPKVSENPLGELTGDAGSGSAGQGGRGAAAMNADGGGCTVTKRGRAQGSGALMLVAALFALAALARRSRSRCAS